MQQRLPTRGCQVVLPHARKCPRRRARPSCLAMTSQQFARTRTPKLLSHALLRESRVGRFSNPTCLPRWQHQASSASSASEQRRGRRLCADRQPGRASSHDDHVRLGEIPLGTTAAVVREGFASLSNATAGMPSFSSAASAVNSANVCNATKLPLRPSCFWQVRFPFFRSPRAFRTTPHPRDGLFSRPL